jgi:hypothetical protein
LAFYAQPKETHLFIFYHEQVVGTKVTIHSVSERQPVPLAMHHVPIATTFAFFDSELNLKHHFSLH